LRITLNILNYLCPQLLRAYLVVLIVLLPFNVLGQEKPKTVPDGTEGEVMQVLDSTTQKKPWNMLDLGFTTFKFGAAFIYEYAGYGPDETTKAQLDSIDAKLEDTFDVRDFRVLVSGQLKTKRTITWKAGIMYDGDKKEWFIRESGILIGTPEIWGSVFIGRTKEGISLSKVMNGYSVEAMERHMAIDAVPILADGIKWLGYLPKQKIVWNTGIYTDWLSKDQGFSTYSWQFAARVAWLPIFSEEKKTTLHIGGNFRIGQPEDNMIRLRSRPESNPAPFFIDTGTFSSNQSTFTGGEIYYNRGPFMVGGEYMWQKFNSNEMSNPVFSGGEILVSYILTGSHRPYMTSAGIYTFVPVRKSIFEGGWGEIEALVRYSEYELNDGPIQGGRLWKITPMINWFLSSNFRFGIAYGYGVLDRFSKEGATNFFQTRMQILLQ